MRTMIFTYGLNERNRHLMPWRIVCEVAAHLNRSGTPVRLVAIGDGAGEASVPLGVAAIGRDRAGLRRGVAEQIYDFRPDAVFWPVTLRRQALRLPSPTGSRPAYVGYLPGGVFGCRQALQAARRLGLKAAHPYVAEALAPKRRRLTQFDRAGVGALIAMTEHTARVVREHGWPKERVWVVPPGRDADRLPEAATSPALPGAAGLPAEDPFFLFMGPPSKIRGIMELLEAFERVAAQHDRVRLVCLFRADGPRDQEQIERRLAASRHRERIWTSWQSLDRVTLSLFMGRARAVVLPFLLVPSEIPLAVIEAMGSGTPVIANDDGGTGGFVRRIGLTFRTADSAALADAMARLLMEPELYWAKVAAARQMAESHPGWKEVAAAWLETARSARP